MTHDWLETELQKLDLTGRDAFHTHLLRQEIPMWLAQIREGEGLSEEKVAWLIARRGFNQEEAQKFRTLATWLTDHQEVIRAIEQKEIARLG